MYKIIYCQFILSIYFQSILCTRTEICVRKNRQRDSADWLQLFKYGRECHAIHVVVRHLLHFADVARRLHAQVGLQLVRSTASFRVHRNINTLLYVA